LTWSHHREVAGLEEGEQERLLDEPAAVARARERQDRSGMKDRVTGQFTTSGNLPEVERGQSRDEVAGLVGWSGRTSAAEVEGKE